jgi:pyruvate dehydrogenase E2 component (dihydrolipoamide acetyltransferase)
VISGAIASTLDMPVTVPTPLNAAPHGVTGRSESSSSRRFKITPAAKRRAVELGVDLERIQGAGPDDAIELADIEKAALAMKPRTAVSHPEESQERMRRAIAAAMSKSNREIPHYYLETRIDMSRPLAWLEVENRKRLLSDRLLPAVLLLKTVALALGDVPELNGFWIDDRFRPADGVHVGMAVAMKGGGLVAPAVHDANKKSLDELMAVLNDLIPRVRAGRLRSSEMTDATATLTNLGDLGVETVFGVIYPPQVALVGLGKVSQQPWVENGVVCARPVLTATLSADHRATDGRRGGLLLDAIRRRLQSPEQL